MNKKSPNRSASPLVALPLKAAAFAAAASAMSVAAMPSPVEAQSARNGGVSIVVFTDRNFRGRSIEISRDVPSLERFGIEDRVVSISARGSWELCERRGFSGRCRIVSGDIRDLGGLGDGVSSIRFVGRGGGRDFGGRGGQFIDDRFDRGWGHYNGRRIDGRQTVFFPGRIDMPDWASRHSDRRGPQWGANAFCRAQGLNRAIHFETGRRGRIVDVLCAK